MMRVSAQTLFDALTCLPPTSRSPWSSFRMTAGGGLTLEMTDPDVYVRHVVPAVDGAGSWCATLPLEELVTTLPRFFARKDTLALEPVSGGVLFDNGTSRLLINPAAGDCLPAPSLDDGLEVLCILPEAQPLVSAIRFTTVAASREDNRPVLQHLGLSLRSDTVTVYGTDGCRLHAVEFQAPVVKSAVVLFDSAVLKKVSPALLPDRPLTLSIQRDAPAVVIQQSHFVIRKRVNPALRYPDVDRIISKYVSAAGGRFTLRCADLRGAVASLRKIGVKVVALSGVADGVVCTGATLKASARIDVPATGEGDAAEIRVDPAYLADALGSFAQLGSDEIALLLPEGDSAPAFIESSCPLPGIQRARALVMPIRT